jgi:hypothetical protein
MFIALIGVMASWAISGKERNPLEAGLVVKPWQHARSSCRAYASGNADPLLAVAENSCYLESGADDSSRQQHWRGVSFSSRRIPRSR